MPGGLLVIAAVSHELWRRFCPLAFISQVARALNRQRRTRSHNGRLDVVGIRADSWLGQHHVQLQWTLLIAGLCLRLLAVNNSAVPPAVPLLSSMAAAIALGLAETIGEMGVITGQPRSATVVAEKQGATLFQVRSDAYENLLQRSAQFNRDLLRQLAE